MFKDFEVQSYRGTYQVRFAPHQEALVEMLQNGDVVLLDSKITSKSLSLVLFPLICIGGKSVNVASTFILMLQTLICKLLC